MNNTPKRSKLWGFFCQSLWQKAIFSTLFFLSTHAWAQLQSKEGIDLRPLLPPIHDQKNTGLCASITVSDALGVFLGKKINPASVFVRYHQKRPIWDWSQWSIKNIKNPKAFYGAPTDLVLAQSLRSTLCTREESGFNPYLEQTELEKVFVEHQNFRRHMGPQPPDDIQARLQKNIEKIFPTWSKNPETYTRYETLENILGRWMDHNCGVPPTPQARVQILWAEKRGKERVADFLEAALRKNQVAIIGYLPHFFRNSIDPNTSHASTIVGMRYVQGQREFLLRNSWGQGCWMYDEDWRNKCHKGYLWIDEQNISKATYLVLWLEGPQELTMPN